MSNRVKIVLLSIVALCSVCCLSFPAYVIIRETSHRIVLQRLSEKLGVYPSWDAVHNHIYGQLEEGMPRQEILQKFDEISRYTIEPSASIIDCEIVKFRPGILNITSYALELCYKNDSQRSLEQFLLYDY